MNTLTNSTINPSFERGVHSVARLQKKSEGTTIIPTPKSATAKDTKNALVLVRSWRLLQTRKMTNPFAIISKESCAQHFHQFLERCRALGTFDPQQSLWKLVLKQFLAQFYYWSINEGFARKPFARHIILFVASIMTIVAICIVQAPLPPHTGDKWRPVS